MDCEVAANKMVPLSKVVSASIIDMRGDIGHMQQLHTHWAARGMKKLQRESLKLGKQRVQLVVNGNTRSAILPVDFEEEFFVGFLDHHGKKVSLRVNTSLVNEKSIEDVECIDKCPKCDQNLAICNDMQVSETVELVVINDSVYEKTIVKKLYPNGDYFLETTTPILNVDDNTISYFTQKEFINNLDLKPCGCLETTPENLAALRSCRPDVYCGYFTGCSRVCNRDEGSYIIMPDMGLIQLSANYRHDHVYLEYYSFIPRRNGQYLVPEVAFETLVGWIKFKSVENKSNVSINERTWVWNRYKIERGNMEKELGRIPLDVILQASMNTPKLDIYLNPWRECFRHVEAATTTTTNTSACETQPSCTTTTGNTVIYLYKDIQYKKVQFKVGDVGAPMVAGQSVLNITDANIFSNSINVVLDGVPLYEDMTGAIYYNVTYSSTGAVVTIYNLDPDNPAINYGVLDSMKLRITYSKTV